MKKLLVAISVLAVAMMSCEKDVNPVSTEFELIGTWEALRFEYTYQDVDTLIRPAHELEMESYPANRGDLIINFISDSLLVLASNNNDDVVYSWTYDENTLYLDYNNGDRVDDVKFQVETLSNTSLVVSHKEDNYLSDENHIYYGTKIYFGKVSSVEKVNTSGAKSSI